MARLAKLSMPKRSQEMDLDELLEKEESEAPEDEAMESPEEQAMEDELEIEKHERPDESNPALASVSDEELLAELAKRGLSSEAEKEPSEPSRDDEEYL